MQTILAELRQQIDDPCKGLPEAVFLFASAITPLINVDLLIKDPAHRTLLTWRQDEYGTGWHIPGGIIRFKETIEQRLHAVAHLELGATVKFSATPLTLQQVIIPGRNERGHFISLLYRCELLSPPDYAREYISGPPKPGQWQWHARYPDTILKVHAMYKDFIEAE